MKKTSLNLRKILAILGLLLIAYTMLLEITSLTIYTISSVRESMINSELFDIEINNIKMKVRYTNTYLEDINSEEKELLKFIQSKDSSITNIVSIDYKNNFLYIECVQNNHDSKTGVYLIDDIYQAIPKLKEKRNRLDSRYNMQHKQSLNTQKEVEKKLNKIKTNTKKQVDFFNGLNPIRILIKAIE